MDFDIFWLGFELLRQLVSCLIEDNFFDHIFSKIVDLDSNLNLLGVRFQKSHIYEEDDIFSKYFAIHA